MRPVVSLTGHFSKVADNFVVKWLLSDIRDEIDYSEYGNRSGYSTCHDLIKLVNNNLYEHAHKPLSHSSVKVTEFSKAFHLIDHNVVVNQIYI